MKTNSTIKVLGLALAIVVLLFGGMGITGAAAQAAIPGDALYSVKTTIEDTRLSLSKDAGERAQMHLSFAEQRLTEISGLVQEGRYREINKAVLAFEENINSAIIELQSVAASDPARAASIAQKVTAALTVYAQTLSDLAAVAPDSIKPEMNRALDTTQIVTGLGRSAEHEGLDDNGNDLSVGSGTDDSVNGNSNGNGTDDSINDNSNDSGMDDSVNDNSNDSVTDDRMNGNSNDNAGTDDSINENSNDNAGTDDRINGNSNGSDDSVNDNSSSSGTDDSINDNSSGSGSDNNSNDSSGGSGSGDNSNDNGNDSGHDGSGGE